jgi:formylglycine-generating enzyme
MTKKTSIVPSTVIIMVIMAVLLCLNVCFIVFAVKKGSLNAVVGSSVPKQPVPAADCTVGPETKSLPSQKESTSELPEARVEHLANTPAHGKNMRYSQSKPFPGMVVVPGGTFSMGSPEGIGYPNEHPRHAVNVDDFYMDTTEVTQSEYTKVMNINPSHFKECSTCPVENVSWNDAAAYCGKVGKRLPTEAEWEYACRAGSTGANYWGNDKIEYYAWYAKNSEQKSHPVGQKKPNSLGLYDMIGNAWEWCSDWYDSTYYEKSPLRNPLGPDSGMHRVFRGGSWASDAVSLRSSSRDGAVPEDVNTVFGFRCAASRQ